MTVASNAFATFGIDSPAGTVSISLGSYANNPSRHSNDPEVRHAATYKTPIEGRPWVVIHENTFITTRNNERKTLYRIKFLPSKSNVESVELETIAQTAPGGLWRVIKPASVWIGVTSQFQLSPYGQTLTSEIEKAFSSDKLNRLGSQNVGLNQITEPFDNEHPRFKSEIMDQIDEVLVEHSSGTTTAEACAQKIQELTEKYKKYVEAYKMKLNTFQQQWAFPNPGLQAMLDGMGIPAIDPSIESLVKDKIALANTQKTDFIEESNFIIEGSVGEPSRPKSPEIDQSDISELYGYSVLMNTTNITFSNVYRFYEKSYCIEPSRDTVIAAQGYINTIQDPAIWQSMLNKRIHQHTCPAR